MSTSKESDVVIVSAVRTPMGSFQGGLASVAAPALGAAVIARALTRAGLAPALVTDVVMGNVLGAGLGQAPARQAAILAGVPSSAGAVTVNKVCGSGMHAIIQCARALQVGDADVAIAGGMESMSRAPYLLPKARDGYRLGHQQVMDSIIVDGLWDPHHDLHMGNCAERCAEKYRFSRVEQEAYAIRSFQRATTAQQDGAFADEIVPVEVPDSKGRMLTIDRDEGPSRVNYEKIPRLRPAFDPAGTVTAATSSTLNDGAAALVLTTRAATERHGVRPLARVAGVGRHAQDPLWFTTAPIAAAEHALRAAGWHRGDVDLWEINEAFAVVPMAFMHDLAIRPEIVNVNGGAIALGHPIGCSGARIVVTLLAALRARGRSRGLAAICIGGGEGLALALEIEN